MTKLSKRFLLPSLWILAAIAFRLSSHAGLFSKELTSLEQLNERLEQRSELTTLQPEEREKYALVINGDDSTFHKDNVLVAYRSLRFLDFSRENIFLLTSEIPRVEDGKSVTTQATKENLGIVFDYLSGVVDENDLFLVYTTGHGMQKGSETVLGLESGYIFTSELKGMIGTVKAGDYVLVADQCYSGDLAHAVSQLEGRIASFSSTDSNHGTFCGTFCRPFWSSFRGWDADKNNDGLTSLDEAFSYASKIHKDTLGKVEERYELNADAQMYRTKESPNFLE